jgi:hypothetical protein
MRIKTLTIPLETRVDIIPMATCLRFFVESGLIPTTKSRLVALSVQTLAAVLEENKRVIPVASIDEALSILENIGLGMRNKGKIPRSILEHLTIKEATLEGLSMTKEDPKPEDLESEEAEEAEAIRLEEEEAEELEEDEIGD